MNSYKKIILSLSLLTLMTQTKYSRYHAHICNDSIHMVEIIPATLLTIPWFLWKKETVNNSEIEAGWHSPHKEGVLRSISSASLSGSCLLGAIRLLFCLDNESFSKSCIEGTTYSNAFTWMKAGATLGALCGLVRWGIYNTPDHSIKRAQELSNMPEYQESRINTGLLLLHNEQQFWNNIEATYCTNKYPLVSANYTYEIIEKRLSRIISYLDKATKNGASGPQLITIQALREKTSEQLSIVRMVLVAIKRRSNYYNQVQAQTQDNIAATQEKMLAEQRWHNLQQSINSLSK